MRSVVSRRAPMTYYGVKATHSYRYARRHKVVGTLQLANAIRPKVPMMKTRDMIRIGANMGINEHKKRHPVQHKIIKGTIKGAMITKNLLG
jgi:hypothetical protein